VTSVAGAPTAGAEVVSVSPSLGCVSDGVSVAPVRSSVAASSEESLASTSSRTSPTTTETPSAATPAFRSRVPPAASGVLVSSAGSASSSMSPPPSTAGLVSSAVGAWAETAVGGSVAASASESADTRPDGWPLGRAPLPVRSRSESVDAASGYLASTSFAVARASRSRSPGVSIASGSGTGSPDMCARMIALTDAASTGCSPVSTSMNTSPQA